MTPPMDERSGAAGFVGEQRFNRRATVVILIGTFALAKATADAAARVKLNESAV